MGKHQKLKASDRRKFCKVVMKDDKEEDDKYQDIESDFSVSVSEYNSPIPAMNTGNKHDDGDKNRYSLSDIMSSSKSKNPSIGNGIRPIKQLQNGIFITTPKDFSAKTVCPLYRKEYIRDRKVVSTESFFHHQEYENEKDTYDVNRVVTNNCDFGDEEPFSLSDPKFQFVLPSKIANMLYPHQREGLKWHWSLHCNGKGGILGDDMGLGKTMQICAFLAGLFHSKLIKRVLIVAPKTLLPHWKKELGVVGLSEKTREFFGTCAQARLHELQYILQDNGVLLTTYDIARNNVKSLSGDHDKMEEDGITWDYIIIDEGHVLKNYSTQRAKNLRKIPCRHRNIITGTLLQNNLKEMWALVNFCCPGLLGDKRDFKHRYELPILRGNDKKASERDKFIGSLTAQDLRTCIKPYFLRRLKSEVFCEDGTGTTATLPNKNDMIVWLRLSGFQRQLYKAFLNSETVLSPVLGSAFIALEVMKKICDHPLLLTKRAARDVLEGLKSVLNQEDQGVAESLAMHIADVTKGYEIGESYDILSCKISFIMSLLDKLIPEGHNVLIFSQTRIMLDIIQVTLHAKGYKFLRMDGNTKASDRLKIVKDFQEGRAPIFLLTTRVGGLGLTLTKADRVIVVDPHWNPSIDNQSVDRAYRIGQEKDVIVYRLVTCGTIEEKIYKTQIYKWGLFKSATEDKMQISYFSYWDRKNLFSLPKQGFDVSLTQQQLHKEHDSEHKMDSSLKVHIKFLESLGIAGISHHSLLFSKTALAPVMQDHELRRIRQLMYPGNSFSHRTRGRNMDAHPPFASNPKDYFVKRKNFSGCISNKLPESEIKERYELSNVFPDKKANPDPIEMWNQSWVQRRISTIIGDEEVRNESRTRPPVLKVDSKATVESSFASTSRTIFQRVRYIFC
ncbi:hypothetical protein LXL04_022833 [Taraxacum kok-saghyz]